MSGDPVRAYYASHDVKEWQRLERPEGAIEFAVTTRALARYLPPGGRVLDIGGGPGRYTIWLAQRGYRVILADLTPNLLAIARQQIAAVGVQAQVEDVVHCDVRDLSRFAGESFDAVLCLGPFYHLVEPAGREQAAAELVRVLKPGGTAFVAFIPFYIFLIRALTHEEERHHLGQPDFMARLLDDGVFLNDVPGRFNAAYGVRPGAIAPFFARHGLRMLDLLADMGFVAPYAQQVAELAAADPAAYDALLDLIAATANDPSLLGTSIHLLYVGEKAGVTANVGDVAHVHHN